MSYEDFESNRLRHLDLIQSTVARLAGNSFLVKGWAITVSGALIGFALNQSSTGLAILSGVAIAAFWLLDAYFLRAERLFRALYDEVRAKDERVEPFWMGATGKTFVRRVRVRETSCDNRNAALRTRAFFSLTLLVLYGGLLITAGAIAYKTYNDTHATKTPPARRQEAVSSRRPPECAQPLLRGGLLPRSVGRAAKSPRSHLVSTEGQRADEGGTPSARRRSLRR